MKTNAAILCLLLLSPGLLLFISGCAHTFHGWLVGAQNLTRADFQDETSGAQIIHAITTGPGVMPAFGKKLSQSEIEALARYVRTLRPNY